MHLNRLNVTSRQCRFCGRLFHDVSIANEDWNRDGSVDETPQFIASWPSSKTKFESTGIPKAVLDTFNEAERCRGVGALIGASACLRRCVYTVCDDLGVEGRDYKEKIAALPVNKAVYRDLLRQVKFLGDHMTKPDGNEYTKEEIDLALEVLPLVIDDLYGTDEKVSLAQKILAKVSSQKAMPAAAPSSPAPTEQKSA